MSRGLTPWGQTPLVLLVAATTAAGAASARVKEHEDDRDDDCDENCPKNDPACPAPAGTPMLFWVSAHVWSLTVFRSVETSVLDAPACAEQSSKDVQMPVLRRAAARHERARSDRTRGRPRTPAARAPRVCPGGTRRGTVPALRRDQVSRGRTRVAASPKSWSPIQLTAQTTTTVPTYDQKPSMEKFGAIHSASATIPMLITR